MNNIQELNEILVYMSGLELNSNINYGIKFNKLRLFITQKRDDLCEGDEKW